MVACLRKSSSSSSSPSSLHAAEEAGGHHDKRRAGAQGAVDKLFIFGAPAHSDPGLSFNGGCIPGLRAFSSYKSALGFRRLDFATLLSKPLGFEHNKMDVAMFDTATDEVQTSRCPEPLDTGLSSMSFSIHHSHGTYVFKMKNVPIPLEVRDIGLYNSYTLNTSKVRSRVEKKGWALLASATEPGGNGSGPQVAHLTQEPDSGRCLLSFQGSNSVADVQANVKASKVSFCGLEERVHKGYAENMMRMTQSPEWQSNIRTKLPSCASVWAVGHSMGGAMASIFTACIHAAKSEDYYKMNW